MVVTLPSVIAGWIHGLKIVAVAVVVHAIIGMTKDLTPDIKRKIIALFALISTLLWQTAFTQIGLILLAVVILCVLPLFYTLAIAFS